MKRKSYKVDIAILIVLVITIFTMSAAYAALSKTLNLTYGNAVVRELYWYAEWDIHSISVTTSGGATCTMNDSHTEREINVQSFGFTAPGQSCTAKVTLEDQSSGYNSKVQSVNFVSPSGTTCTSSNGVYTCGSVRYRLCWDSTCSSRVQTNDIIEEAEERDVYLIVDVPSTTSYVAAGTQNNGKFSVILEGTDA